jgi:transposase
MIRPEHVYLAVEPVDMRWGIERLSCHVQHAIGRTPCDGSAYAFTNRQRSRLKLLIWDTTGVWLCQRRLHRGLFHWPKAGDSVCMLSAQTWQWLIAGVEWQRLEVSPVARWQT